MIEYDPPVYRPPGEWRSFLVQATIGCSHNGCTFCGMYMGKKFRIRSMDDIIGDIREAAAFYNQYEKVFLCDGDAIVMKTEDLLEIIGEIKKDFPHCRLISTYAAPEHPEQNPGGAENPPGGGAGKGVSWHRNRHGIPAAIHQQGRYPGGNAGGGTAAPKCGHRPVGHYPHRPWRQAPVHGKRPGDREAHQRNAAQPPLRHELHPGGGHKLGNRPCGENSRCWVPRRA